MQCPCSYVRSDYMSNLPPTVNSLKQKSAHLTTERGSDWALFIIMLCFCYSGKRKLDMKHIDIYIRVAGDLASATVCSAKKNCCFTLWDTYKHIYIYVMLGNQIFLTITLAFIRTSASQSFSDNFYCLFMKFKSWVISHFWSLHQLNSRAFRNQICQIIGDSWSRLRLGVGSVAACRFKFTESLKGKFNSNSNGSDTAYSLHTLHVIWKHLTYEIYQKCFNRNYTC